MDAFLVYTEAIDHIQESICLYLKMVNKTDLPNIFKALNSITPIMVDLASKSVQSSIYNCRQVCCEHLTSTFVSLPQCFLKFRTHLTPASSMAADLKVGKALYWPIRFINVCDGANIRIWTGRNGLLAKQ